jgi:hypothetical protein
MPDYVFPFVPLAPLDESRPGEGLPHGRSQPIVPIEAEKFSNIYFCKKGNNTVEMTGSGDCSITHVVILIFRRRIFPQVKGLMAG